MPDFLGLHRSFFREDEPDLFNGEIFQVDLKYLSIRAHA